MNPLVGMLAIVAAGALGSAAQAQNGRSSDERIPPGPAWEPLDGLDSIVDDRAVTRGEIARIAFDPLRGLPLSTAEDQQRALADARDEVIRSTLRVQAGRRMGLDPLAIDAEVDRWFARQTDDLELSGQAAWYRDLGLDRSAARADVADSFYRLHHMRSIVGAAEGTFGRPYRDRFVRPGRLHGRYEANRELLGEPTRVTLIDLPVLASQVAGDLDLTKREVERFYGEIDAAEDPAAKMRQLSATWAGLDDVREARGLLAPISVFPGRETIAHLVWASEASEDSLSPLLPIVHPDTPEVVEGYRLLYVVERVEGGPAPPFFDEKIQATLADEMLQELDDARLDWSSDDLREDAFVAHFAGGIPTP